LLSTEGKTPFVAEHRAEYERLRRMHGTQRHAFVSLASARERHTPIVWRAEDIAAPRTTGVTVLDDFPLQTLREYIDWTPFFHTWELKGVYPRIFEHPQYGEQAKQLFAEGNALLDQIIARRAIKARAVYGLFPARSNSTPTRSEHACSRGSTSCVSKRRRTRTTRVARCRTSWLRARADCTTTSARSR
jgi:5-methyltetrahydrofolate--homocysteine methyltransferase